MKKLLLVADVRGWAWWWMAQGIAKYAPPEYDVRVIDNNEFGVYTKVTPGLLMEFDGICQFSWVESTSPGKNGVHWDYATTVVASHGLEFDYPHPDPDYLPGRIATKLRNKKNAAKRLPQFDRVICVSPRLQELSSEFNRESVFCMPGVDTEIFKPAEEKSCSVKLRVGWCGQKLGITKGFSEVLEPLMAELGDEKYDWRINHRGPGDAMSQAEMVAFYQGLDLFLSTSYSEGHQMPPHESMACGVDILCTDCGSARLLEEFTIPAYQTEKEAAGTVAEFAKRIECIRLLHEVFNMPEAVLDERFSWKRRAAEWCRAIAGEKS